MADTTVGNLQDLWNAKYQQLHGLAVSIATERARGNEAGVAAMRPVFAQVAADLQAINQQLYQQDLDLSWTDKFLLAVDSGAKNLTQFVQVNFWDKVKPFVYIGIGLYALHLLIEAKREFR